jgi:hypothetical protein
MPRLLALSVAALSIWIVASVGPLIQTAYANSCSVDVKSTPAGADLYIDGFLVGKTPLYYTIGHPTTANVTVTLAGYQRWSEMVVVPLDAHVPVNAVLIPLAEGAPTVTRTVTITVTTTHPTFITYTTTSTNVRTSIVTTTTATTITSTLEEATVTTTVSAPTVTITAENQNGLPPEITYASLATSTVIIIAAIIIITRRR